MAEVHAAAPEEHPDLGRVSFRFRSRAFVDLLSEVRRRHAQECGINAEDQEGQRPARPVPERRFLLGRAEEAAAAALAYADQRGILERDRVAAAPEVQLSALKVEAFSIRGLSHREENTPCQDAWVTRRSPAAIVGVVADGPSEGKLTHIGAKILAGTTASIIERLLGRDTLRDESGSFVTPRFLARLHTEIYYSYLRYAGDAGLTPPDAGAHFLAATTICAVVTPRETAVLALGDGVLRWRKECADIELLVRPAKTSTPGNDASYPPHIGYAVRADYTDEEERYRRHLRQPVFLDDDGRRQIEAILGMFDHARAFHVAAHGPTSDIAAHPLEIFTDGHLYGEEWKEPSAFGLAFPFTKIFGKGDGSLVRQFGDLFNLTCSYLNSDAAADLIGEVIVESGTAGDRYLERFRSRAKGTIEDLLGSAPFASAAAAFEFARKEMKPDEMRTLIGNLRYLALKLIWHQLNQDQAAPVAALWDDTAGIRIFSK